MKKFLSVVFTIIMATACTSPENSTLTGWDYFNYSGSPDNVVTQIFRSELVNGNWNNTGPMFNSNRKEVKFDVKGNIEYQRNYDGDFLEFETTYIYENGKVKGSVLFDGVQKKNVIKENYFSAFPGFIIENCTTIDLNTNTPIMKSSFEWDQGILKRKKVEDLLNNENYYISNKYDNKGYLIEEAHTYIDPAKEDNNYLKEYVYLEFDQNDNWIKRVELNFYNKKIGTMEIRKITY